MPSNEHRHRVKRNLDLLGINFEPSDQLSDSYKEEYRRVLGQRFRPYYPTDALDLESLATVCYYSEFLGIPLILAEIPEVTHKLDIANTLTRVHLSNLLNVSGRECVYQPEIKPNTPWTAAHLLFPDLMTAPSDFYVASLLDSLATRFKRPLILQAGVQAVTTPLLLQTAPDRLDLASALTPPDWKVSLVEDYFVEDLVERLAILDVMQHGLGLFEKFDSLSFKSTYASMAKFASPTQSKQQRDELRYVHVRLLRKYVDQLADQSAAARAELQKAFLAQQ